MLSAKPHDTPQGKQEPSQTVISRPSKALGEIPGTLRKSHLKGLLSKSWTQMKTLPVSPGLVNSVWIAGWGPAARSSGQARPGSAAVTNQAWSLSGFNPAKFCSVLAVCAQWGLVWGELCWARSLRDLALTSGDWITWIVMLPRLPGRWSGLNIDPPNFTSTWNLRMWAYMEIRSLQDREDSLLKDIEGILSRTGFRVRFKPLNQCLYKRKERENWTQT